MTEIKATIRSKPQLTTPIDTKWDWETVNARLETPSFITQIKLLFVQKQTVIAPKGTPAAIKNLYGYPIFEYKELKGKAYQLVCAPSPGFPGS